jgi:NAD(P)H-nitrite reductase large subunit
MRHIIIGAGVAGLAAIEGIRSLTSTDEIYWISDDPHGYYSRPGLAYYLSGELHDQALFPRTSDSYKRLNFRYLKAQVTGIHRDRQLVEFKDKTTLNYDRLLVAVGAQALPLTVPGATLEGVVKLDHMEDVKGILRLARRGRTAVVIGGGITALELVEGFHARHIHVHYLLRGDRYWSNVLDEHESHLVENRLAAEGVQLHYHAEVIEILGRHGKVSGVRLANGQTLKCDLVAGAIGIRPRLGLAKQAGLEAERGILVNEHLQTNDPVIYAAGDVAQVYDPMSGKAILDSLWNPARQQGLIAGLNMAGQPTTYTKAPPFNVTRLAGLTTTIIGTVGHGRDEDITGIARGDSETWRELPEAVMAQTGFDVNHVRLMIGERTLLGAVVMGDQKLSLPIERIITEAMDISPIRERLLAPDSRVADILLDFWQTHVARNN